MRFPRILGHEVAGEVTAVGPGVCKSMIGMHVGVPWTYSACGQCQQCLRGEEVLCEDVKVTGINVNGGYAEFMVAPAAFVIPLPDELDFVEAAPLLCPGVTTYKALKVGGIEPGKKVAIVGIGGLGHLALQFARYMGAEVIAVTGSPDKEHLARELGAHYTVNSTERNLIRELRFLGGADLIVTTISDPREIERCIYGLAPDGTLVLAGVPRGPLSIPPEVLINGRRRIMASPSGSRYDFRDLLNFCVLHNVRSLAESFPLEHAAESHRRIRENKPRFRDILVID